MRAYLEHLQTRFAEFTGLFGDFLAQQRWAAIFGILLTSLIAERITLFLFKTALRLTSHTSTDIDDRIVDRSSRPIGNFILLFGAYLVVHLLRFPDTALDAREMFITLVHIAAILNALWLMWRLVDIAGDFLLTKVVRTRSSLDDHLVPILRKTARVFIVILGVVYLIQAMGYSVSGLLAGLGIGGLAVAMAAKDSLANFFGSVMILVDRPFKVGDWIRAGEDEGVVEEIGLRSTRIRTFPKTLISVPNSVIANVPVDNVARMPKRRVKMTVGVTYSTSAQQMQDLVEGIKQILRDHEGVDQDFSLVSFTDFGASSLDVLVYYFTKSIDWAMHLRVREEVNLAIMRLVDSMGLSIAFPTRTVHVQQPS